MPGSDFSSRRSFPGTEGGPFELLVRYGGLVQRLPALVFALVLLGWAWLLSGGEGGVAAFAGAVFLADWLMIGLLPRLGRSYGPARPAVLLLALLRAPFYLLPLTVNVPLQLLGSVLALDAFWIEPQRLMVVHQRLETNKLPVGFRIRLLHFGDLHMELMTPRDRQLVERIDELAPDMICFTGDFLSYSDEVSNGAIEAARQVFARLKAPMGVYAVRGSPPVDRRDVVGEILAGLDVTLLEGEAKELPAQGKVVDLIGVPCSHRPFVDGPVLEGIVRDLGAGLRILLYHSPDLAPIAASLGIDLQLSGHTHGGQVRLPFFGALYASSLYGKRFEAGRYRVGDMALYVTRGLGLEGMAAPRVRFLCRPEIVLWELVGTGPPGGPLTSPFPPG